MRERKSPPGWYAWRALCWVLLGVVCVRVSMLYGLYICFAIYARIVWACI